MKKYLIILTTALALSAASLNAGPALTYANTRKITNGLSKAQVEAILGQPSESQSEGYGVEACVYQERGSKPHYVGVIFSGDQVVEYRPPLWLPQTKAEAQQARERALSDVNLHARYVVSKAREKADAAKRASSVQQAFSILSGLAQKLTNAPAMDRRAIWEKTLAIVEPLAERNLLSPTIKDCDILLRTAYVAAFDTRPNIAHGILQGQPAIGMDYEQARLAWGWFGTYYYVNTTTTSRGRHDQVVLKYLGVYCYFDDGILTSYQTSR